MKYRRIISEVFNTPWAIRDEKLQDIVALLWIKANGGEISAEEIEFIREEPKDVEYYEIDDHPEIRITEVSAPVSESRSRAGAVAVLPLFGTISHRMGMMSEMSGGTSVERFTGWLRAAVADPQIKNILIDADSPGGTVPGVPELADEIFKAKESKPIIAVANAEAASAAYWIISQASEIVVSPSAEVGSIGVFAAHQDISKAAEMRGVHTSLISAGKFKTEANPFEPLTDEARASLQSKVNDYYGQFTKAVARGRNVGQQQVENGFGEGRMVSARQAVAQGMADRIATMDQTLTRLGVRGKKISLPPKAEVQPEESAQAPALPAAADNTALLHEMRRRELELYS